MPFTITQQEIRRHTNARSYQRGVTYQRQDRVLIAEWDEESHILFGEVRGSGRNVYEQEILFPARGRERFRGLCTCPVGANCKHVIAVLLEWIMLNQPRLVAAPDPHAELQRWQEEAVRRVTSAQHSRYPEPGQTCLLYCLQTGTGIGRMTAKLEIFKSRRLKRGGWGKLNRFSLAELTGYGYYGYNLSVFPIDHEIANLLYNGRNVGYGYDSPELEGDTGLLALQRLLKSGRCFYREVSNPPLSLGPGRTAELRWSTDEQTSRFTIELEQPPSNWALLPTSPPWYLDINSHQCGPIEQPLTPALLSSLAAMPPVRNDQLADLSHFLVQKFPQETPPLPVALEITTLTEPPVPVLLLFSVPGPDGRRHHLARLRFAYGPISLPPSTMTGQASEMVQQDDRHWRIVRHAESEDSARQQLERRRLVPAGQELAGAGELDLLFAVESLPESARCWQQLLAEIPELEAAGWQIEFAANFALQFESVTSLEADIHQESDSDWFEIGLKLDYDGQKIDLLPLLLQWLENQQEDQPLLYQLEGNRWLEVPSSMLKPIMTTLVEVFDDPQRHQDERVRLPRTQAHNLLEIEDQLNQDGHQLAWRGGGELRQLGEKLRNFSGIAAVASPPGLQAELRDYQLQGLAWLQFLREYDFNGVLADDMGLGKTLQTLSHLLLEKQADRLPQPALVVAPTSVLSNWQREVQKFAPQLSCLILHGPKRAQHFDQLADYDLVITNYALIGRDMQLHQKQNYSWLILDEAQAIKNPAAQTSQALSKIRCRHRLCLTGTPLENHLGELWSLFHFLMPGFLGQQKKFNRIFRTPIEKHRNSERQEQLQLRLAPFVLRRNKEQVTRELPPKTQMIREAELGSTQAKLYESLRLAMVKKVSKLLEDKGLQRSHIEILDALLKLRQVCCDPRLVKLDSARKVKKSAKLDALMALLDTLLEENRKILIFSQFTSMLRLIEEELQARGIGYSKLTGQTRKRDEAIALFQEGDVPVFLISLKAGGVGLNLTAADTVIHYDPWWNPAVEEQATDRAHRIGQDKPVFVYKLICSGTVEEKILRLQSHKQELAQGIYRRGDQQEPMAGLKSDDILNLLTPI